LYRRVIFPAILAAALPHELSQISRLFAHDSESFSDWHRRILRMRIEVAKRAGPQFRLLIATLMTDEAMRRKVIKLWKENLWETAVAAISRYQRRGQVRSDLRPEAIARAVISVNLGYIVARAARAGGKVERCGRGRCDRGVDDARCGLCSRFR